MTARCDALVNQATHFPARLGQVLQERRAHKDDLLRVLERPEVPLHNNGRESDIRGYGKVRQISGSSRSASGRRGRDTLASLKNTCRIRGLGKMLWLAALIRQRAAQESAARSAEAVPA